MPIGCEVPCSCGGAMDTCGILLDVGGEVLDVYVGLVGGCVGLPVVFGCTGPPGFMLG